MASGLVYILQSLVDLYLITFVLRLAMQWVRADFRNPIVQFVLTVTNPLVAPLRKMLPPIYKIDTATLLVYLALQTIAVTALTQLMCTEAPGILASLGLAAIRGLRLIFNVYFFVVFGFVLMSWIAQGTYNPSLATVSRLLRELATPVLAPLQRIIPSIAGLDLSPIFLLLGLGALTRMLYGPAQAMTAGLFCPLGAIL
jgi:YggT family protein